MSNAGSPESSPSIEIDDGGLTRNEFRIHLLASGFLLLLFLFVAPKVEACYTDFGVPLPRSTIRVFRASHLGLYLAPISLICLAADRFVLKALHQWDDVEWTRFYSNSVSIGLVVLILWTLFAMGSPMFTVSWNLSG